jgi:hypothetical protein
MAPEHRLPARRDGAHDPSLDAPETASARLSKGFAMAAEDIRATAIGASAFFLVAMGIA